MADMKTYYECDPSKNVQCQKTRCKKYGGPCHSTTHLEFAKQPIEKVRIILPVTHEEAKELDLLEAEE